MSKCLRTENGFILGVRRIKDHGKGAFTASWHEAQVTTGETWEIFLTVTVRQFIIPNEKLPPPLIPPS